MDHLDYAHRPVKPEAILAHPKILDFACQVALLLITILHLISDAEPPHPRHAPRRGYLALSHSTTDFHPASLTGTA